MQIIQASTGRFYRVTETGDADLAHVWNGVEVRKIGGKWLALAKPRVELVRKAATRLIAEVAA